MTNSKNTDNTKPSCVGKYVISLIDNETYCRKNGSFFKHIQSHGYTYETYVNQFYCEKPKCLHCDSWATFVSNTMSYKDTCGSVGCRNKQISIAKQKRTQEQWDVQRQSFRRTMLLKTDEELDQIKRNRVDTYRQTHGIDHRLQRQLDPDVLSKLSDRNWMYRQHHTLKKTAVKISEDLGCGITTATNWLHRHDIAIKRYRCSQVERDILNHVREIYCGEVVTSDRSVIAPYELDIYVPEHKIAIEVNGVYWHGELNGKDRRYHVDKQARCNETGVRLIHITDQEWIQRNDIVKSRLAHMLGRSQVIYARRCTINKITPEQTRNFFTNNHIQGSAQSRYCYGLFHNDELVAAITFGVARFTNDYEYELIRYASKLGIRVMGGASKLFHQFIQDSNATSIVTYSDRRWNTGNMYRAIGFEYSHTSAPNYMYFHRHRPFELKTRHQFQKHKLQHKLDVFDSSLSEWKNMTNNGYDRIWDCGNDVWCWTKH